MNEFITWSVLGTYGGALAMVMVLTQFTKDLPFTKKLPTQIWSYILALIVLFPAMAFTSQLTLNTIFQTLFNGVIVSIAANGGFGAIQKMVGTNTHGDLLIDTSNPVKDIYEFALGSNLGSLADKKTVTLNVKTGVNLSK